jgi:hypothetical protein
MDCDGKAAQMCLMIGDQDRGHVLMGDTHLRVLGWELVAERRPMEYPELLF